MPTSQVKPLAIPKQLVWEEYRRVAANKGAPGVDEQSLGEFEADLKDNLCAKASEDDEANRQRRRRLVWSYDDDGSLVGSFRLPPEPGAALVKALQAATGQALAEPVGKPGASPGPGQPDEPLAAARADSLVELVTRPGAATCNGVPGVLAWLRGAGTGRRGAAVRSRPGR
ncbi:MAG: hypothetical protein ACYDH5_00375 [Acidimicrobiales bacterium]